MKNKNKNKKLALLFILMFTIPGGVVFAVEEAPPTLEITLPPAEEEPPPTLEITLPPDSGIEITDASAFPVGFNPNMDNTTITYTVSQDAKVDIEIVDANEQTVLTLVNNGDASAGEHTIDWDGTEDNDLVSDIVPSGQYQFKITAKDPNSGAAEDTAIGRINVIYAVDSPQQDNQQVKATLAVQNGAIKKTAETGPGILIYSIFPLAGYVYNRKKFKKRK